MDHTFNVQGMTCGHCEMTVKKAIARIDPNAQVEIDRDTGKVNVHSDKTHEALAHVIADEGYQVA
ncbi:MAG: heavy-metal-associated domain-containing protein [Limnohabitans sp.]|nr:heavy-metal-associated domain-containing protein [Limnohabitans sp.]